MGNDGQSRKGIKINHKNISFLGRNIIVTSDEKYTQQENKNNKGVETSCRKILEFEKDRRTSKVSLRVGSTFGHTHAANKQPGMGSRKYEKATTLPTSASPSQTFDRDHQFSSKATLGGPLKSSSITSSSPSATAGSSFWSRSTAVPKFGSHPASA